MKILAISYKPLVEVCRSMFRELGLPSMDDFFGDDSDAGVDAMLHYLSQGTPLSPERNATFQQGQNPAPWAMPEVSTAQVLNSLNWWGQEVVAHFAKVNTDLINLHGMILEQNARRDAVEKVFREQMEEAVKRAVDAERAVEDLRRDMEESIARQSKNIDMLGSTVAEMVEK